MTLGKRIKQLRQEKGLTQAQLAYLVNKGESTVRTWELDRAQPSPKIIRLLCDVLGTSPNILLDKEGEEKAPESVTIDSNTLGKRLKAARGETSLREFSKKCNISPPELESIENGYDTKTGKAVTISIQSLVDLSLGSGLSLDYLMGKDDPAFNGTPLEGMSRNQASLLLFAEFLGRIDDKYPKISDKEKAALIFEFNKHDPVDLLLFALNDKLSKNEEGGN